MRDKDEGDKELKGLAEERRDWEGRSRSAQIRQLVLNTFIMGLCAGGVVFELFKGIAVYGLRGGYKAHLQSEPGLFGTVMLFQFALFALFVYLLFQVPLKKGLKEKDK